MDVLPDPWLHRCVVSDMRQVSSNAPRLRHHFLHVAFAFLLLASPERAGAYGVLTHQQLIDQSWTAITVSVLRAVADW
jgi:hypothetical protein